MKRTEKEGAGSSGNNVSRGIWRQALRRRLGWALCALLLPVTSWAAEKAAAPASPSVAEWKLDDGHTNVGFVARHLAFAKVRGEFKRFQAEARADSATGKLTGLVATVEAASVDTGIAKRDEHLRSDDFFAADKNPQLRLELKSIAWSGNRFTAKVALTLRGVTREVDFSGEQLGLKTVDFGGGKQLRTAYEARGTIDRKAFGLKFNKVAEGTAIVGDEVDIVLEASFWRPLGG